MSEDIAIKVEGLGKCYHIYDTPRDRLKQFVLPRLQRMVGRQPKQYFREFWALRDVLFEVKKGETVGIIGRNGSGKSTLLQIICGTLNPTCGTVTTNGRIAALLELGSGFNPEFTGRENVYMNGAVLGLSEQEIAARFDEIAAFADIGEFLEQPVKNYSSGMMMRLAFAVIAHVDADILVIDEALSVGDAFFTQKCMRFLREFMKLKTVLFVSHDTGAIVNLCSRAVFLEGGRLIEIGKPKEVTKLYLASLHGNYKDSFPRDDSVECPANLSASPTNEVRDMREEFLRSSEYRNDVQIFEFQPDYSGYGVGGAKIISVDLLDAHEIKLTWVVGGEDVNLRITCLAKDRLHMPIVGFQVRDRLGQVLFGDNTYLTYQMNPLRVEKGEVFFATFGFRLPLLPTGEYAISAAIAEGTQENHIQRHWIHEALIFKVHASSIRFGLVGLPMKRILLKKRASSPLAVELG